MNTVSAGLPTTKFLLFLLPAFCAWMLAGISPPAPSSARTDTQLRDVSASVVRELESLFNDIGYAWPPAPSLETHVGIVPPIAVRAMPADLDSLSVDKRKSVFFRILAPLVAAENRKILEQREFLQRTFETFPSLPEAGPVTSRVRAIASHFNVGGNLDDPQNRALLLRRVDGVPAALVLAQAANESGWGTSRFAREANNLFGMWTWDKDAGIAPRRRDVSAQHFIRVFDDLRGAVSNYLHTINVGGAYRELRVLRAAQRARGESPGALQLAGGLARYSARGEEYVREIRSIIEYNGLHELPPLRLGDERPSQDNMNQ